MKPIRKNIAIFFITTIITTIIIVIGCEKSQNIPKTQSNLKYIDTLAEFSSLFDKRIVILKTPKDIFLPQMVNYCTVDKNNNIYTLGMDYAIYVFTGQGEYIKKLSRVGHGEGEYQVPTIFTLDDSLNLYLNDFKSQRILIYNKYFDFIKEFEVKSISTMSSMIIYRNKLYCLLPSDYQSTLRVYDIHTGAIIKKWDVIDDLFIKFHSFWAGGGLSLDKTASKLYFALTHIPRIYILSLNSGKLDSVDIKLESFMKISSIPTSPNDITYSVIVGLYAEKEFIILKYITPAEQRHYDKDPQRYAILSKRGRVLKENLTMHHESINQFSSKKYISMGKTIQNEKDKSRITSTVYLYGLKY